MSGNFHALRAPFIALFTLLILWLFLSSSHAQVSWTTTKTTINSHDRGGCVLSMNKLRVHAHPGHLDVEEEAQIGTVGAVRSGNDPNSLEIVAQFTLPPGAAMIGALLWDGNRILEGKLLDRKRADSLYEDVVRRDTVIPPVRPRDPIVLEYLGNNAYRFKVFPVSLNFSRRMRLRYQLPPSLGAEGLEMRLQTALGPLFPNTAPLQADFLAGPGSDGVVVLAEGTLKRQLALPRTIFLAPSGLGPYSASPVRVLPVQRADQAAVKTAFQTGLFAGHYFNLYAAVPQALLVPAGSRTRAVSITVRNASRAYDFPVLCEAVPSIQCGAFAFNGKSAAAWNDTLEWQAFDGEGRLLQRYRQRPRMLGQSGDTGIAVTWAAAPGHFSEMKEYPSGPVYGFVDAWASLLALEKDSLNAARKLAYADSGVPRLVSENINDIIAKYEAGQIPPGGGTALADALKTSLANPSSWRLAKDREGFLLQIPGLSAGQSVDLTVFDFNGRSLGTWKLKADGGALRWNVSGIRTGTYLLQIRVAGIQAVKKVVL